MMLMHLVTGRSFSSVSCYLKETRYKISPEQVHVKRSFKGRDSALPNENGDTSHMHRTLKPGIVRKGKLVVVDLAGSERIDKSGICQNSEVIYINDFFFLIFQMKYFYKHAFLCFFAFITYNGTKMCED